MPPRFPGSVAAPPSQEDINDFCNAARDGNTEAVTGYLDRFGKAIIDKRDVHKDTALTWAAWMGHVDMVNLLLNRGADIDAHGMNERTALGWAANGNRKNVVELLIGRGADINLRDENGKTPADLADSNYHSDLGIFIRSEAAKRDRIAAEKAAHKKEEEDGQALTARRLEELKRHKPPRLRF